MKLRRPELTIAPLIDCVFLLLLFFAIATTLTKEHGMPIHKPKAKHAIPRTHDVFVITVTKDEKIYLGKEEVNLEVIAARLRTQLANNPKISVIIASDKAASCGKLIEILDLCKEQGAELLSVATLPKPE